MEASKRRILPQDIAVWGYLAVQSVLLLIFRKNLPDWHHYLFFNLFFASLAFLAYWSLTATNGWQRILRHLYPILMFTFLYEQTGHLIFLIQPHYFDYLLNRFEFKLLGVYPTIWLEKLYHPWINEILMLGYVSYYFLTPILGISLYLKNKIKAIDHFLLAVCIGFFISYLFFLIIPVEGPQLNLAHLERNDLTGPVFTPLAKWVIGNYGIHGGCLPSSHVAVALITLIFAWRYHRRLGNILAPFVVTLCIGTFWGRFHYVTDMVAGLGVGWFAVRASDKLWSKISDKSV